MVLILHVHLGRYIQTHQKQLNGFPKKAAGLEVEETVSSNYFGTYHNAASQPCQSFPEMPIDLIMERPFLTKYVIVVKCLNFFKGIL